MNFYQRLKELRKKNQKTQTEIAKVLEMDQSHYAKYENGVYSMPIEKYIKLAIYYNISLDYLTGVIDKPDKLER